MNASTSSISSSWPDLPANLSPALQAAHSLDAWLSSSTMGYMARLYLYFYAISILSSCWVFFVARGLAPGLKRAVACLPIVVLQLAATPILVDRHRTPVLIVPVCGILSLAAFKVAAFAFGRGPLALSHCPGLDNLRQFGALLSFPVIPRAAFKISRGSSADDLSTTAPATPASFLYSYACKASMAAVAATLAVWPVLPVLVRHWFYALCLSLSMGSIWDFWCLFVALGFGVEVAPSFDKPWLSSSFADYWGRRWNLTTTYMLRVLIYEPVMEGRLVPAAAAAAPPPTAEQQQPVKAAAAPAAASKSTAVAAIRAAVAAAPAGPEDEDSSQSSQASGTGSDADARGSVDTASNTQHGEINGHSNVTTEDEARPSTKIATIVANSSSSSREVDVNNSESLKHDSSICKSASTNGLVGISNSNSSSPGSSSAAVAGTEKKKKKKKHSKFLKRFLALQATFAFSGLWHLLIFYYATGLVTPHWFTFFSVQAPILAVEAVLVKWAKAKQFILWRPVAVFLTNFLLIVVANPLFFGPCDWSGMCTAMMGNAREMLGL